MTHRNDEDLLLPPGEWRMWHWAALRGAGFPASLVLRLAASDAAASAVRALDAEEDTARARDEAIAALRAIATSQPDTDGVGRALKHALRGRLPERIGTDADAAIDALRAAAERESAAKAELETVFASARVRVFRAAQELAADPKFAEAVTWQNRSARTTAFSSLQRADATAIRTKDRLREALVANYAQRYATKNDTIGFFGPVGWAKLASEGPGFVLRPGPKLVAERNVFFEHWAVEALAAKHSADSRLWRWMTPRRYPFLRIDGASVHSAVDGKHSLTEAESIALLAADGRQTAGELARALVHGHGVSFASEDDVRRTLESLRDQKLIAFAFEVPFTLDGIHVLRKGIERIDDAGLRAEALAPLEALEAARRRVADAGGDANALDRALGELETVFTELTGEAATRNPGAMYASRQLVFEDSRRDIELTVGPMILEALGPPLSLVLTSARWFTYEAGKIFRAALRGIHDDAARRSKSGTVRFADLWFRAQRVIYGTQKTFDALGVDLQERWSTILAGPAGAQRLDFRSEDLRARVQEAFAAPAPGWLAARHHSPDVMIAAPSAEAITRGEFVLVLGEVHAALNTLDYATFIAHHPVRGALDSALDRDFPAPHVVPVLASNLPDATVRLDAVLPARARLFLETGFELASSGRDRVVALSDLTVVDQGGELGVVVDGHMVPAIELFGRLLSLQLTNFKMLPAQRRSPRITIDRLIVARETWTFGAAELAFAQEADERARFLGAQRWRRASALPRFIFVKAAFERKPVFVDLDAPVLVNQLAKLARAAQEQEEGARKLVVSEMVPSLDETWLTDASGERYTSELRIVAVDRT